MYFWRIRCSSVRLNLLLAAVLLGGLLTGCDLAPASEPAPAQPPATETAVQPAATLPPAAGQTQPAEQPPADEKPVARLTEDIPASTQQVFLPPVSAGSDQPKNAPSVPLAFLKNGDLWLADLSQSAFRQLTQTSDLLSFAWSPDGQRLATFNGHSLCTILPDGSPGAPCLDLALDDFQAAIEYQMVWSPDQRFITLWNPLNPWDEGAIGWLIVALDGSKTWRIEDPVDWGLDIAPDNEPGGFTGQPVYLPDGSLVGALSHRWLCGSGGCHYQLYRFDLEAGEFSAYPNKPDEDWSEGGSLLLSTDRRQLVDFGVFQNGCDSYFTFMDLFDLASQTRRSFNLEQEAVHNLALAPNAERAIITRSVGCSSENTSTWEHACGLAEGLDIRPMQFWDLSNGQRIDLAPGLTPAWSPDGGWIAFRSCLAQNTSGSWEPSDSILPSIYVMDPNGNGLLLVSDGSMPAWQP